MELEVVANEGKSKASKGEIDVDARDGALDDWDVSIRYGLVEARVWRDQVGFGFRRGEVRTVTSMTPSVAMSISSKRVKNSSRSTCLGTTQRVSISAPGP